MAGLWSGLVLLVYAAIDSVFGDLSSAQSGIISLIAWIVGLILPYPYVFGLNGGLARFSRLPAAEDLAELFHGAKRGLFWLLGAGLLFVFVWAIAVLAAFIT